jgi:hypothetical protein
MSHLTGESFVNSTVIEDQKAFAEEILDVAGFTKDELMRRCLKACTTGSFGAETPGECVLYSGSGWRVVAHSKIARANLTFDLTVIVSGASELDPDLRAVFDKHMNGRAYPLCERIYRLFRKDKKR